MILKFYNTFTQKGFIFKFLEREKNQSSSRIQFMTNRLKVYALTHCAREKLIIRLQLILRFILMGST